MALQTGLRVFSVWAVRMTYAFAIKNFLHFVKDFASIFRLFAPYNKTHPCQAGQECVLHHVMFLLGSIGTCLENSLNLCQRQKQAAVAQDDLTLGIAAGVGR